MPVSKAEYNANRRARYLKRKLDSVCIDCAAGLQDDDGLRCVECAEKAATSRKVYYNTKHGRAMERAQHRARYARLAVARKCPSCQRPATRGVWYDEHHAFQRDANTRHRARKAAGISQMYPRPLAPQPQRAKEPAYTPFDEVSTIVRLLRALRWMDWTTSRDWHEACGIPDFVVSADYAANAVRNAAAVMITRLVRLGLVERRRTRNNYEYLITAAGRAELEQRTARRAA